MRACSIGNEIGRQPECVVDRSVCGGRAPGMCHVSIRCELTHMLAKQRDSLYESGKSPNFEQYGCGEQTEGKIDKQPFHSSLLATKRTGNKSHYISIFLAKSKEAKRAISTRTV